jgi:antitoxin YobK
VAKSNIASVVIETERYSALGMNGNLVVIENINEYAYCLDTSNMENSECPVIAWHRQGGLDDYHTAKNFYEFLSKRLLDAKEAWEEEF